MCQLQNNIPFKLFQCSPSSLATLFTFNTEPMSFDTWQPSLPAAQIGHGVLEGGVLPDAEGVDEALAGRGRLHQTVQGIMRSD